MNLDTRHDIESTNLRECLRILGPARDEDGFQVRRHIAGVICSRAAMPFANAVIDCDPRTGAMSDSQHSEILSAMRSALGPCEFSPTITCSMLNPVLSIGIVPDRWPGTP